MRITATFFPILLALLIFCFSIQIPLISQSHILAFKSQWVGDLEAQYGGEAAFLWENHSIMLSGDFYFSANGWVTEAEAPPSVLTGIRDEALGDFFLFPSLSILGSLSLSFLGWENISLHKINMEAGPKFTLGWWSIWLTVPLSYWHEVVSAEFRHPRGGVEIKIPIKYFNLLVPRVEILFTPNGPNLKTQCRYTFSNPSGKIRFQIIPGFTIPILSPTSQTLWTIQGVFTTGRSQLSLGISSFWKDWVRLSVGIGIILGKLTVPDGQTIMPKS